MQLPSVRSNNTIIWILFCTWRWNWNRRYMWKEIISR